MSPPLLQAIAYTIAAAFALLGGASCHAQPEQAPDAATTQAEGAMDAEAWLTRLEADAGRMQTLKARVRLTSLQGLLDDRTVRFGDLTYAAATGPDGGQVSPARFAVKFDRILLDEQMQEADQAFVFDGRWLLERNGRERTATRRELAPADAAGLMQGEGPFPIPLNLKKDRVLERFTVAVMPPAPPPNGDDPEGTSVHLQLTPREGVEMDAVRVDLWFDRNTGEPLRAATEQDDGDVTIIDLFERVPNAALDLAVFDTTLPGGAGWDTQTVPLE